MLNCSEFNIKKFFCYFILLFFLFPCCVFCVQPTSESPKLIYKSKDWELYLYKEGNSVACFMTSSPMRTEGNYKRKGDSMIFINHIAPNIDEVSVKAGYPYSDAVPIAVYYSSGESAQKIIDTVLSNAKLGKCATGSDLNMYLDVIVDETAWSRNVDVDQKAVASMRKGYFLITKGRSPKGTCSVDVYSLLGFSSVYERMLKECN